MKIRFELENAVSNSLASFGGHTTTNSCTLDIHFDGRVKILLSVTVHVVFV